MADPLMSKDAIKTDRAPGAIGPYSQAVRIGSSATPAGSNAGRLPGLVFCSGQVGLDPATGEMVHGGIEAETKQVMKNLTEVLAAAGATWADVARTTIYLI